MAQMRLDGAGTANTKPKASVSSAIAKPQLSGKGSVFAKNPVTTHAPTPPTRALAPAQQTRASYGVGGGGGGGDAGAQSFSAPTLSDDDYLATGADSAYAAQIAALMKALGDYEADSTAQRGKYEVDYGSTLKDLGWMQDNKDTADVDESGWNFNDLNTAAGRSFQNQQNDFAGRGMLQSSLYGTANENLTRTLNDQLSGINTAKSNFMGDLDRQLGSFKNDNTLSQQQARAEAIARRASGISL